MFSQLDGRPLLPNTVTHTWIKLVRRTGLGRIRLHDARHSHASLMLKAGTYPKIVQERLGHASIQITLDTYSHVAPGLQEAAAERFDDLVNPRRENEAVKNMISYFDGRPVMITPLSVILASKSGTPRGIRTHDPRFRRPMLCPLSYRRTSQL